MIPDNGSSLNYKEMCFLEDFKIHEERKNEKVLNYGIKDRWIENPIPRVPPVTRAVIP